MKSNFEKTLASVAEMSGTRMERKSVSFKKDLMAHHGLAAKVNTLTPQKKEPSRANSSFTLAPQSSSNKYSSNTLTSRDSQADSSGLDSYTASPSTRSGQSPGMQRKSTAKLNRKKNKYLEGNEAVVLLSRPQDKFFNRVAEIERLAKNLEKDNEEKAGLHDLNQYFDEAPSYLVQNLDSNSNNRPSNRGHRFSIMQINAPKFGQ